MYVPEFNRMDAASMDQFMESAGAAELVTVGPDGYPEATLMPFIRDGDRLLMHMARANPHWRSIGPSAPALAIVGGAQAYVSPAWYASKREHGRVVPTWNYSAVHVYGRGSVHHEGEWLRSLVERLTERHERGRPDPWAVSDAPDDYVRKQLRAIVGVELVVERIEGKAKLSQNRSEADRQGVAAGLEREAGPAGAEVAAAMRALDAAGGR